MSDQIPNGVQATTWDKIKYAMDRWGLPVVALACVSILFWKDLNEHTEFEKKALEQQGQMIELTGQMHEDHKIILGNQSDAVKTNSEVVTELRIANDLLQKINNEQHGRDR